MALIIGISNSPLQTTFHLRKRGGFIVVTGERTAAEMDGVKLCVFRQQKGTIGRFFRNASQTVNADEGNFANRAQAATANFNFNLNLNTDYGGIFVRYNLQIAGSRKFGDDIITVFKNSPVELEFAKIVKRIENDLYLGYNRGKRKGKFAFKVIGEQLTKYYTLWVALTNGDKIVSNFVKISAYYKGDASMIIGGVVYNKFVYVK
jgi:hypothetical protein